MNVGGNVLSSAQRESLEELCTSALALPAQQRRNHILAECGDEDVRSEAMSLLEQVGTIDRERFLEGVASLPPVSPGEAISPAAEDQSWMPDKISGYRIIRKIGAGGMGDVWEAEQESTMRRVAVKTIRQNFATPGLLKRFKLEAQILGQLQHPAIAQIHEFGTATVNGISLPFFAMELVEGRDLSTFLAEEHLSRTARLQLFLQISDAIAFAHLRGVMHRDIKPNNILIDNAGQPKILDFGLARMTDSDVAAATLMTETGQVQGTLHYMSPEQARGDSTHIDLRSDVYSLGVILYELLTGQLPLKVGRVPLHEAVRVICEESPCRPSMIVRVLRGDLETITLKALEKDPVRRYQNVDALADDIRRHLSNQPILGRPPSAAYQFQKLVARNKTLFGFVASLFVVVVGFGVWMSVLYTQADSLRITAEKNAAVAVKEAERARLAEIAQRQAREQAEQARDHLKTVVDFQQSMLSGVEPEQLGQHVLTDLASRIRSALAEQNVSTDEVEEMMATFDQLTGKVNSTDLALTLLDENLLSLAVDTLEKDFVNQPAVEAALRQTIGDTYRALGLYNAAHTQFVRALEVRRDTLGDEHPDTFETLASIGALLKDMGDYSEAETTERKALKGRRAVLGNDHADTLSSIDDLGLLMHYMGRLEDAETYYREALEGRRKLLGEQHADTVMSLANLANLLVTLERLDEAHPIALEAQEGFRRIHGDDHERTLIGLHNLSHLRMLMGYAEEAEAYGRRALEGFRRVLGDDHPYTLSTMSQFGLQLSEVNRYEEAREYLTEVLERRRRILGNDHPHTQDSISNMGLILELMGNLEEAEAYYRESLEGTRQSLGNDHYNTLRSVSSLAYLLQTLGRLDESEALYRDALEGCRRVLGDEHPQTLQAIFDMSVILRQTGRLEQADAIGVEALAGARANFARAIPHFLTGHGRTLIELKKYAAAEAALLEAERVFESTLGSDHRRTLDTRRELVRLYTAWNEDEPNRGRDAMVEEWQEVLSINDQD